MPSIGVVFQNVGHLFTSPVAPKSNASWSSQEEWIPPLEMNDEQTLPDPRPVEATVDLFLTNLRRVVSHIRTSERGGKTGDAILEKRNQGDSWLLRLSYFRAWVQNAIFRKEPQASPPTNYDFISRQSEFLEDRKRSIYFESSKNVTNFLYNVLSDRDGETRSYSSGKRKGRRRFKRSSLSPKRFLHQSFDPRLPLNGSLFASSAQFLNATTSTTSISLMMLADDPAERPVNDAYWTNSSSVAALNSTAFNEEYSLYTSTSVVDTYLNISNVTAACDEWEPAGHSLFQIANGFYAIAFLIPRNVNLSILLMRCVLVVGFLLFTVWADIATCAPDILAWNALFLFVNSCHVIVLGNRHFPPFIPPELRDLYLKVFAPLKMNKKRFKELIRDASILTLREGRTYAEEDVTPSDERLSILVSGTMKVTCDGTLLHYIHPHQFIDSPEWEAAPVDSDEVFQVTITATEDCRYLCWSRQKLLPTLRHRPYLDSVIYSLVGKDITQKLYSLNEQHNPQPAAASQDTQPPPWGAPAKGPYIPGGGGIYAEWYWRQQMFPRSLSVDAVHTGTKGHVRSYAWRMQARRGSGSGIYDENIDTRPPKQKIRVHFPENSMTSTAFVFMSNLIGKGAVLPPDSPSLSQIRSPERIPLYSKFKRFRDSPSGSFRGSFRGSSKRKTKHANGGYCPSDRDLEESDSTKIGDDMDEDEDEERAERGTLIQKGRLARNLGTELNWGRYQQRQAPDPRGGIAETKFDGREGIR